MARREVHEGWRKGSVLHHHDRFSKHCIQLCRKALLKRKAFSALFPKFSLAETMCRRRSAIHVARGGVTIITRNGVTTVIRGGHRHHHRHHRDGYHRERSYRRRSHYSVYHSRVGGDPYVGGRVSHATAATAAPIVQDVPSWWRASSRTPAPSPASAAAAAAERRREDSAAASIALQAAIMEVIAFLVL